MSADPVSEKGDLDRVRVQVGQPIALRFDYFSDFVRELAANISAGGMFIKTVKPQAPGTQFNFEFKLGDDFTLIRGRGEVVWTRSKPTRSRRPPGMGVRFVELDSTSTRVIERIVEQQVEAGETPFELDRESIEHDEPWVAAQESQQATQETEEQEGGWEERAARQEEPGDDEPVMPLAGDGIEPLAGTPEDLAAARAEIRRLGQERDAQQSVIAHIRSELERLRAERSAREAAGREEIEAARQAEADSRARLDLALQELRGVREMRDELVEGLATEQAEEFERLQLRHGELEAELEERSTELERRSEEATAAEEERRQLLAANERLEEGRRELEAEVEAARERLTAEREEVQKLRRASEETRLELTDQLSRLQAELETGLAAGRETDSEVSRLGAELEKLEGERAELAAECERLRETEHLLEEARELGRGLEAELATVQSAREAAEQELEAMRSEAGAAGQAGSDARKRASEAEEEADEGRRRIVELESALAAERSEVQRMAEGAVAAQELQEDLRNEMMRLQAALEQSQSERRRLEARGEPAARPLSVEETGSPGVAEVKGRPRWHGWAIPAGAGLAAGLLLALLVGGRAGGPDPVPRDAASVLPLDNGGGAAGQGAEPIDAAATEAIAMPVAPPVGSADSVGPPSAVGDLEAAVAAVDRWAMAWSAQDVDQYLAHYAAGFEPPDGLDRAAWADQRRDRLGRPRFIRITLESVESESLGPGRVRVRFFQTYESDSFTDRVAKVVEMIEEDGAWKIVSEQSE